MNSNILYLFNIPLSLDIRWSPPFPPLSVHTVYTHISTYGSCRRAYLRVLRLADGTAKGLISESVNRIRDY